MADSPLDVATEIERSLAAVTAAIRKGTREALRDAGAVARAEHDARASEAPGPDKRFSRSKKPTPKAPLRIKVRVDRDGGVRISPQGPWGLGAEGDVEVPGKHPGIKGKRSWSKGKAATAARLDRSVPQTIDQQVTEAFKRG